jgi:hypothetical protein
MPTPQEFIDQHTDDAGRFKWPADEREREDLAQTFFGLMFIEPLDGWIKTAEDWLHFPEPARPYVRDWNEAAKIDRNYRAAFQTLTAEQRAAVSKLLRHAISGALFSALASIDQFPDGRFEIAVRGEGDETPVPVVPGWLDLHERFHEWRQKFSAYPRDDGPPAAR